MKAIFYFIENNEYFIPLTTGGFTKVSKEDLLNLLEFRWCKSSSNGEKKYARACINGKITFMHRYIMLDDLNDRYKCIDHKDGNGLNNTRENLRICSFSENIRNSKRKKTKNFDLLYKGISRSKNSAANNFCAALTVDKKQIYLGSFKTQEEAARAYDEAARKHHGEFAKCNFETTK